MSHSLSSRLPLTPGPGGLDFFHVMRRMECTYAEQPRLGTSLRAAHDSVRVGQEVTLGFCGVELKACTAQEGEPARLTLSSGLMGTDGPMPLHLTEYVWARSAFHGDGAWTAFLDVFHHRMACLLYRAWATSQPVVSLDRPHDDVFASYIGSLCGLPHIPVQADAAATATTLQFSAVLANRRRHAGGLAALLTHYFDLPVRIEQWVGQWLSVPVAQRVRLGRRFKQTLGRGQLLGRKVWDRQHKLRVVMGPMDFSKATHLQPETPAFNQLVQWVQLYTGGVYDWDLELRLLAHTIMPLRLGANARVGRSTWLGRPQTATTTSVCFAAGFATST